MKALEGLKVDPVPGTMTTSKDHQASYHEIYGTTVSIGEYPPKVFTNVITPPPDLTLAPEGTTSVEAWIKSPPASTVGKVPASVSYK